ncbi:methyltransferase domain-containing protein [Rhodobacteraceae bacterium DSL-40]|uniref:methyltransferase domain-containing protein n=1 Tax=Amaricoccus sp. B4 TaxID=3368557 RepID=UPI000DAE76DB
MSDTPRLFDSGLLTRRRARARATGPADFLHAAAAGEISERLFEVNRRFQAAALVTPRPEIWCETLAPNGLGEIRTVPDADVLELAPGAHDLVIHGLCLHWANDPVGQLIQARRALRPDGLLIAVLFGGDTLSELRAALAEAEAEVSGGISPRVAPMGEIRALGGLLQRAGLALPVADGVRLDVSYETPLHLMRDLRAMGETNVMADRLRKPMSRALLARACTLYGAEFAMSDGRVRATFELVFLTGWAPDPGQQKPLRPGSAVQRLSDALETAERETERDHDP